jgi:hypothetical protein
VRLISLLLDASAGQRPSGQGETFLWNGSLDILSPGIRSNALFRACGQGRIETAQWLWNTGRFHRNDTDGDVKGYRDHARRASGALATWLTAKKMVCYKDIDSQSLRDKDPEGHRRTKQQRIDEGFAMAPSRAARYNDWQQQQNARRNPDQGQGGKGGRQRSREPRRNDDTGQWPAENSWAQPSASSTEDPRHAFWPDIRDGKGKGAGRGPQPWGGY